MPITTETKSSKLKLILEKGKNDKGEPIAKSKTFSNLKPEATNESIYQVADTISKLQKLPLIEVSRVDEVVISKQ
ncbi:hypothetical protein DUF1659 [Gottschalkia acidurici 9a]|uniref:DUF1659 domain-containing protein n=1 Tax=Gottschalkia acidurici (strain ATCC 7906 / DSM 604 / BCRC 14475 / CIP 104303 / KCTC 5404 / NCIMB 10678 / 9a) TaxID=1128398 RepID=K0ATY9_GOTA9|nr:DUF1659 domain-containing protein [Gottschalkia acidurici]AFS77308.1 hypothetical protein DUF1659 [Gottschalkia acidurici 9a]